MLSFRRSMLTESSKESNCGIEVLSRIVTYIDIGPFAGGSVLILPLCPIVLWSSLGCRAAIRALSCLSVTGGSLKM